MPAYEVKQVRATRGHVRTLERQPGWQTAVDVQVLAVHPIYGRGSRATGNRVTEGMNAQKGDGFPPLLKLSHKTLGGWEYGMDGHE